jgi:2-polyprenyl-6-methoxyphenol hydroxylase-like FAD-dependent oxidoreductase
MASISTRCCVAGGGPAGVMLGFLLARAGVDVVVLEKHADFLRDFRGDTIHPSTLRVMKELGLLDEFLTLPHQKVFQIRALVGGFRAPVAEFSALPPPCNFIAMMPQWDFLNFIAAKGKAYPTFHLLTRTAAASLIEEGGRIVGVNAQGPDGPLEVRADLVVAADGRHSILREAAGLKTIDLGSPMDVLWFRAERIASDDDETLGRFDPGRIFIRINRGDYWQCAYVIAKGSFDAVKAKGVDAFKADAARLMETPIERLDNLKSFSDVSLLSVAVDRLERWWKSGFLAIGDAAHAMSPVGGVGVNLAVQDAVAAANRLAAPLLARNVGDADLAAVESRRTLPARVIQFVQVKVQNNIIGPTLGREEAIKTPLPLRVVSHVAPLRRLVGRLIGMGVRPEHVQTPQASVARQASAARGSAPAGL